jgi:hypothetical protein
MSKQIKPNPPSKSILDLPLFKDQISFHAEIKFPEFNPTQIDSELLKGLFHYKTTQQLHDICERIINNHSKNSILELPFYAGKTLISFALAYHYAHNLGKNAVIIYSSEIQRDIAFLFHKMHLAEKYFDKFPNFILINDENDLKNEYLYYPQVYITDIYSVHKILIHSIREKIFWEQFQLCVLEDCNNYTDSFGANCSYVIRRLLSKLDSFNKDYQLLCTTKPINNRVEFISKLTGVKEFSEVANVDSARIPSSEVFNWYPPVNHINYESSSITVYRENFHIELGNLIQGLLETNTNDNYIGIIWEKFIIAPDDIANLTRKFNVKEEYLNNIIFGNNLNDIRLILLKNKKNLDLSDLSSIVIVGSNKPLSFYLTDLMHIGISPKQIYFFDTQSPTLQYQIMRYLRNPKELEKLSPTERSINLDLNDSNIISQHWSFLNDEQPNIRSDLLNRYFPKNFISTIGADRLSQKGSYLILNKDLKFFPREKRTNEQLHFCSSFTFFDLILVEGKNELSLGRMADSEVRVKCYPSKIIIFEKQKYFIRNVNWTDKKIFLQKFTGDNHLVYKLSNYFNFTIDEGYQPQTLTRLNNRVFLIRGIANISEQILNLKTTQNFEEYSTLGLTINDSFENAKLNYIEFRFPLELFRTFFPPQQNPTNDQDQEQQQQEQEELSNQLNDVERREQIYATIFPILHTFGHLLIESIRVNKIIPLEEIKLFIPSLDQLIVTQKADEENEQPQAEWDYCSVYVIDLSNRNIDILDSLFQSDLTPPLKIMREILLNCPCEVGSNTCIKVDYCNIENCGITNQQVQPGQQNQRYVINPDNSITDTVNRLNKINTLRFLCDLLDEDQQRINNYIRWKRSLPKRTPNDCINENDKLQDMVKLSLLIIKSKGMIKLDNFYPSRFFISQEMIHSSALGVTRPGDIAFRPGLTENELFETIFHEYFHNYEFDITNNKNPKNNINPNLTYFDWDNIDNPRNIPYIGLLVVEGAAVWFSLRMMEIFSDFSYLSFMRDPRTRFMEYRAGLLLLLEVERQNGFKKVFELLKSSFKVTDFIDSFYKVINDDRDSYLRETNQQPADQQRVEQLEQQVELLQRLWCLDRKGLLNNTNRITYFLRIRIEPARNELGLGDMLYRRDKSVSHIKSEEILRYANMPTDQFVQDPQIVRILNKHGMPSNMEWDGNIGFICEGCASNCNLFTACMLNGGRNIFREILLVKFPPPHKISFGRRILRKMFRRYN